MIKFYKYQGAGNDFIIIDNLAKQFTGDKIEFAKKWCNRKFGIGSDGIIFIELDPATDFEMDFYNPDGTQSFCGNGSRCAVAFAKKLGLVESQCVFKAVDGNHSAKIEGDVFHILMSEVSEITKVEGDLVLDTGSPHYIKFCSSIENLDIVREGRSIRNSSEYKAQGINVNFIEKMSDLGIRLRTYERGVEDETLACGTGATAAAISFAEVEEISKGTIAVKVEGGNLKVSFEKGERGYSNIWLIGPALEVFNGVIND